MDAPAKRRLLGLSFLAALALIALAALRVRRAEEARLRGAVEQAERGERRAPVERTAPALLAPSSAPSAAPPAGGGRADASPPAPPASVVAMGVLRGRVRLADGGRPEAEALADGRVSLAFVTRRASLAADGSFEFGALAPDTYTLSVFVPGYEPIEREVRVQAGRTRELELVLTGGLGVSGRVVDEHGAPLPEASVTVDSSREDEHGSHSVGLEAALDERGRFSLTGVPAGVIEVEASCERRRPARLALGPLLAGDERADLELVLVLGHALGGRVRASDGRPVAGASVLAFDAATEEEFEATTDDAGRFRVDGLGEGPFRVWAWEEPEGEEAPEAGAGPGAAEEEVPVAFAFAAEVPAEALDLELRLAAPGTVTLELRGRASTFEPRVLVFDLEGRNPDVRSSPWGELRSDARSRAVEEGLVLEGVPPGERWLVALEDGDERRTGRARVTVVAGASVRAVLTLEPAASLSLTLVRAGAPVPGSFTVRADDGFALRLGPGDDGFAVRWGIGDPEDRPYGPSRHAWLPPGHYRVAGEFEGRRATAEVTLLAAEEVRELRLELE